MKTKFFIVIQLLLASSISAQLVIGTGAQFSAIGSAQVTLNNSDFINNGSFAAGNGMVSFIGNAISSINCSQSTQFYELEMNKSNGSAVLLQKPIGINQRLLFTSGFLDLNGFNLDLGSTAHLDGEQESTRIKGANGGQVLFSTVLNAPAAFNPANLGVVFTSTQNLGNVIIKRGHQSQINSSGTGSSILRYYDIVPANNTGLNATLRINYFDGELNGLNENALVFWKTDDAVTWVNHGFTTRNAGSNFVEKTAINSFSRWTLSTDNNTLPVYFTAFDVQCEESKVAINWKTAQEQNSSHFIIERSADGIAWVVIGNLPAAGNSTAEKKYVYADNDPAQNNYYRVAEYDVNGYVKYTEVLKSSCHTTGLLRLWPNPVSNIAYISINATTPSHAVIKIFDNKGALIKIQTATILTGNNRLAVDMSVFAKGIYHFNIEWNNGQDRKIIPVLKQ